MKLISWNVENARACLPTLSALVAELGSPEVFCLQELRIREIDAEAIVALEHALPGYHCHYSLPRDRRNVTFRGGRMYGVATFVQTNGLGEVPVWDREGRVVVVRLPGLAIVNVYAVNGTFKPYFDSEGSIYGDRHELKRRFQKAVVDLGRALRSEGPVIMAGDWNVSRTAQDTYPRLRTEEPHARARAEFNARLAAEGFVDIWRAHHPDERAYTWFNRRARTLDAARVDYVLVSADLLSGIRRAEILERLPWSDHSPVLVEFDDPA